MQDTKAEWVHVWHDPVLHDLELHHATYIHHTFTRHMHDWYVVGMIETGTQAFFSHGTRHITPAGDIFVINPGEAHTGEAVTASGYTYRTFYPDVALLTRVASEITGRAAPLPIFSSAVIHDADLSQSLRELHAVLTTAQSPLEHESRFLGAFGHLIARYAEPYLPEQRLGSERHAIKHMCQYLHDHVGDGVTLSELAHVVGLSPWYALRVFEQEVGITPHAYLESIRIRQAQRLLVSGIAIAQVAYDLGFSSQSHLTNRFKRLLGMTPGQYVASIHEASTLRKHKRSRRDTHSFVGGDDGFRCAQTIH